MVQNQLTMCNYESDMESVLQCDIFLFGLNDQAFISKIISEESPDVTAATIRQKLKKLEAGQATAKYIKGTNMTGKDPSTEGVNQVHKQAKQQAKGQKRKGWNKDSHHSQNHPAKKQFKPNPQHGQPRAYGNKQQKPKSQQPGDPSTCKRCGDTRHRQGFNCPATKYQCRKCQKYGHFTSKCLTKPQNATVNSVEEVNALAAFTQSPDSIQANIFNDSMDDMYICTVNTNKPKKRVFADLQLATLSKAPKYLKVRLDTAADVSMMSKSVYQQLYDDPQCEQLAPVTTNTVMHDHSTADVLGKVTVNILKDNKQYSIPFQVVPYEASTLLSCEQVTKHGLVIIPEQKQTPKNAVIYDSNVDIKYVNFLQRNKSKQTNWHTGGESVKQPLTSLD